MKTVLTIAGSDSSGGAGIQADMKTITMHGMYAMSAVTALTAQNTTGVYGVMEADASFVGLQLDCIFQDIRPDAVKIGMVSNGDIMKAIAAKLREYGAAHVVVDPVMVATSGSSLMREEAVQALGKTLLPLAEVVTPNLSEAENLSGIPIGTKEDMEQAAQKIALEIHGTAAVLVKGGHLSEEADDYLYLPREERGVWIPGERIHNPNTHGTGCTLSSAIACQLAAGCGLEESVRRAKRYLTGAIAAGLDLGKGRGPLNHMYLGQKLFSDGVVGTGKMRYNGKEYRP